jgi:dolichyl-phosphate beta-glucosyltransferase
VGRRLLDAARELPRLLAPIVAGKAEIAIGRATRGRADGEAAALPRARGAACATSSSSAGSCRACCDTQCGFKAFTSAAALNLFGSATIDGWAFDLEILALAAAAASRSTRSASSGRTTANSRVNPLKDFWKVIREALTIRRNLSRGVYCT